MESRMQWGCILERSFKKRLQSWPFQLSGSELHYQAWPSDKSGAAPTFFSFSSRKPFLMLLLHGHVFCSLYPILMSCQSEMAWFPAEESRKSGTNRRGKGKFSDFPCISSFPILGWKCMFSTQLLQLLQNHNSQRVLTHSSRMVE